MKFNFFYSKIGSFFFFIQNLSEWHPACRRKYNKIWLSQTGPFSKIEKQALENLKKIFKKYCLKNSGERDRYFDILFFTSRRSEIWEKIIHLISVKEVKKLKKIFKIFSRRFEKIWQKERKNLNSWKKILKQELSKKKYQKLIDELSVFYQTKPKDRTLKVILSISISGSILGYGEGNYIILNLSGNRPNKKNKLLATEVIFHELIHSQLEKNYFLPLLEKFLKTKKLEKIEKFLLNKNVTSIKTLINELATGSLLPDGYLSQKYFGRDIKKELREWKTDEQIILHLKKQNDFKLIKLAKYYIENKKPLDRNFLKVSFLIIKNFINKEKG